MNLKMCIYLSTKRFLFFFLPFSNLEVFVFFNLLSLFEFKNFFPISLNNLSIPEPFRAEVSKKRAPFSFAYSLASSSATSSFSSTKSSLFPTIAITIIIYYINLKYLYLQSNSL